MLRRRLSVTGDLVVGASDTSTRYDSALARALSNLQQRLGLADDAVLGDGTRAALNVPVDRRIQQIRLNLERGRWVLHHLDSAFVIVNIAGLQRRVCARRPHGVAKPRRRGIAVSPHSRLSRLDLVSRFQSDVDCTPRNPRA